MSEDNRSFYTINDLIAMGFGSRSTIYRRIKNDGLPAVKVGGSVLIPKAAFEDYIALRRVRAGV